MAAILSATSSDSPISAVASAVPQRMRSVSASNGSGMTVSTPAAKEKTHPEQSANGLNTPIQTPANVQVSRGTGAGQAQHRLQQPRIPKDDPDRNNAERKVSFAPQTLDVSSAARGSSNSGVGNPHCAAPELPAETVTADDDEESFHFPSDDDAFLAALQFEEDGLGRPIDFEVDEGVSGMSRDSEGQSGLQQRSTGGNTPPQLKQQSSVNAQYHVPSAPLGRGGNAPVMSSLKRQGPLLQVQNAPSKDLHAGSSVSRGPATTISSGRPSTGSLGGFHFPPGVVSFTLLALHKC